MANKLKISHQSFQKIEQGNQEILASALFTIAQIVDVPITYFFDQHPIEIETTPFNKTKVSAYETK